MLVAAGCTVLVASGASALAFDGELDPGFGTNGKVTTNTPGNAYDRAFAMARDPATGKIVVAGFTGQSPSEDVLVARYNANGSIDSSFDGDGIVTTPISTGDDEAVAVAVQSDGKVVVAGDADMGVTTGIDFAVVRYKDDGSLDDTFDGESGTGNGIVTIPIASGSADDIANDLAIQPSDQKIVVAGESDLGGTNDNDFSLVRLNTNGSLDDATDGDPGVTFGGDGIVTTDFTGNDGFDGVNAVKVQDDGKIVAGGEADPVAGPSEFALARYDTAGTLDPSFDGEPGNAGGGNGKVVIDLPGTNTMVNDLAIQTDDKIVAAGEADDPSELISMARLNGADGTLDSSFDGEPGNGGGGDGKTESKFAPGATGSAQSVDVQSDGKLVVVGTSDPETTGDADFAFARYRSNGRFDDDFGGDGTVVRGVSSTIDDRAADGDLASGGRILAAGFIARDAPTDRDVAVMRLRDDKTPPQTKITKGPKGTTHARRPRFRFKSSEPRSSFECKLDRKPFKPCDSPYRKRVKRGRHTFRVKATDFVGNTDKTPATRSFKVVP